MILEFMLAVLAPSIASPEAVARSFLDDYVHHARAVEDSRGLRLRRFMSPKLIRVIEDGIACGEDWVRQQPKGSTDKPPFVDCCMFASNPEGVPTSFRLGPVTRERDGRYRVTVTYEYRHAAGQDAYGYKWPAEHWSWRDALLVVKTPQGYKVDDFLFVEDMDDRPAHGKPESLSGNFAQECRGRHWVGRKEPFP